MLLLTLVAAACGSAESTAVAGEDDGATTAPPTTAETTTQAPPTTEASEPTGAPEPTDDPASGPVDGMEIYESNCVRCHASDGSGSRGPSLQGVADELDGDKAAAVEQVTNGGNRMPDFGEDLTAEEIAAVVDYIFEAFPAPA